MRSFKLKMVSGLLFGGLMMASAMASASTTIDFNAVNMGQVDEDGNPIYSGGVPAQIPGYANVSGTCASCYQEEGFYVGTLSDTLGSNHIHGDLDGPNATGLDYSIGYHNDSSGIYLRAVDGSAFKAFSLFFDNSGADQRNGTWEILGFSTAANTSAMSTASGAVAAEGDGLSAGNGTNYAHRVAYQTVVQNSNAGTNPGTAGTLALNSDFNDADGINAIWIHFKGPASNLQDPNYTPGYLSAAEANLLTPGFKVNIDDIVVESVTAVPVPAAVWMFGSGLLGMLSFGRRKAA